MDAHGFETILAPVDFSEISGHALRTASLIRDHCGQGTILAMYAHWFEAPPYFTSGRLDELQAEFRKSLQLAEESLRGHVRAALGARADAVTVRAFEALPADAIRETAGRHNADLIVMGTHGRNGLNRWMLGSVAERVLRESTAPVLTVRTAPRGKIENDDVRIVPSRLFDFLQDDGTFRVVRRAATSEDQLAIHIFLGEFVGLDHAHRVFQPIESRNLGDDWTRPVNTKFIADLLDLGVRKFLVLFRERVDTGIEKILRDGQLSGKRLGGEDGSIALLNKRTQKFPDFGVRIGEIDVASPDPTGIGLRPGTNQSCRLWIVNYDQFLAELHAFAILFVVHQKDVAGRLGQLVRCSMQCVVKSLGDLEEVVAAGDDIPVCRDLEF